MTELHYLISPEWRTLPLSRVLRQGLGFSALGLKSVRERGCVRLDGLISPLYQTPGSAERLSIVLPEDPPSEIEPVTGRLHLLYEDTHLLIVDKPAGMAVHPGPGHHGDTLGNLLMGHYAQEGEQHLFRPVNRLDRSTSGLMCVAKHAYAAERLGSLAAEGQMTKEYLAICEGLPSPLCGRIDAPIGRKGGSVLAREVRPDGKAAVTNYRLIAGFHGRSLVRLMPETGRTHQIRVHMAHIGHPLTGDFLYETEDPALIGRAALHACTLKFRHPITGLPLSFEIGLPEDMRRLIGYEKD